MKKVKDVTGEILFETLEEKSAWIASEEGAEYAVRDPSRLRVRYICIANVCSQRRVWDCLNTTPIFEQSEADGKITWSYTPPTPPTPPPLFTSLTNLKFSLPQPPQPRQPRFQHTMQALSDFTGYIATQTYAVPSTYRLGGSTSSLPPEVEEARREIRALKGLVLNRYVLPDIYEIDALISLFFALQTILHATSEANCDRTYHRYCKLVGILESLCILLGLYSIIAQKYHLLSAHSARSLIIDSGPRGSWVTVRDLKRDKLSGEVDFRGERYDSEYRCDGVDEDRGGWCCGIGLS